MIDPMTAALIAKGVIQGAQAIGGMAQSRKAKKEYEDLKKKGVPRMGTPQEYYELYRKAQLDKGMQLEQAQAQNTMASNLAALERGGSRALIGGAPAVVAQTSEAMAKAAQAGYEREADALKTLAEGRLQAEMTNAKIASEQYALDKQAAAAAFTAGRQTTVSGLEGLASAGVEIADLYPDLKIGGNRSSVDTNDTSNVYNTSASDRRSSGLPFYSGGAIKTPGKFSHDTNPLHVLNNQGKKVAEVTGEEVLVFNPSQVKSLYKESEKGNTNLHKKVRSLLKKFNKK
jgi:hypothetical protein